MTISREELEQQLAHKSPGWWKSAKEMVGRENFYYDRACQFGIVTVDLHPGVTPMFLSCRNPKKCTGVMNSMGYPDPRSKPAWLGQATYEWYRPDSIEDDDTEEADYVIGGGLLLREVKESNGADQAQPG